MGLSDELLEQYDAFFKGITTEDKIAVLHDKDPDGIAAGVIVAKQIERMRGRKIDMRLHSPGSSYSLVPEHVERMKDRKINILISVDISADHEPELIRKVAKFARVLILDHHKIYTKFKEKNVTVIKPQLIQEKVPPEKYSCSKFVFDLANRVVDVSDLDWLAATGSIADIATAPWKPWLTKVFRRYNVVDKKDLFATTLGQVACTINNALVFSLRTLPTVFRTVYKAAGPREVINSQLHEYNKAINNEIKRWTDKMGSEAEHHPNDLIIYYLEPKYHIKATLSTILSMKCKNKTLVLLSPDKDMITVSARRQDQKVPMNNLLECAVKGLQGASAGGHAPAAGGRFLKQDFERFKKQLLACSTRM